MPSVITCNHDNIAQKTYKKGFDEGVKETTNNRVFEQQINDLQQTVKTIQDENKEHKNIASQNV